MTLFFTSPIGFGHATRDIAIAKYLSDIEFVSSPTNSLFIAKSKFKVHPLLGNIEFDVANGELQNSFLWILKYLYYYYTYKKRLSRLISKYTNLIVSDEEFVSLSSGIENNKKCILITDILGTNFTTGPSSLIEKYLNRSMKRMIIQSDCVIIPNFGNDYGNFKFVGPIVRSVSQSRDVIRNRLGLERRTLLVSPGGSNAGSFLIEKVLESFARIRSKLDLDLIIARTWSKNITNVNNQHVRHIGTVENLHEYIFASDIVVSLAGKSTIDECLAYGTPGIFIPIRNHFEQEQNAKNQGYKFEDIYDLDTLIEINLSFTPKPISNNGAQKAADIIRTYC